MRRLKTWANLGFGNIAQVVAYRMLLRHGLHPVQRLTGKAPAGPFFREPESRIESSGLEWPWGKQNLYFGVAVPPDQSRPPRWNANPFRPGQEAANDAPWWTIPDFSGQQGDIKYIWEASRFEWVLSFATRALEVGTDGIAELNHWLEDWWQHNTPYHGPNWKCAQETSIRVLRLVLAASLLGQFEDAEPALVETVSLHLARVSPTLSYARAQQNNHATSEAAALLVGGLFLAANRHTEGGKYAQKGYRGLEWAANSLIMNDGSFSQNSTNYHRFMLDTYCVAQFIGKRHGGPEFSADTKQRLSSAITWLQAMVAPETGHAFNLGPNDCAYLLPNPIGSSRDFRRTLTTASTLFCNADSSIATDVVQFLRSYQDDLIQLVVNTPNPSVLFNEGSVAVLNNASASALLRLPGFRFRPGHCDVLHVGLRVNGRHVLRDPGTIGYVDPGDGNTELSGTSHHNTAQFDDIEQMPRFSRFLWGDWLKRDDQTDFNKDQVTVACAYVDRMGNRHHRSVKLAEDHLKVRDTLTGSFSKAALRWHLMSGDWQRTAENIFVNGKFRVAISSPIVIESQLREGLEGIGYGASSSIPVLEIKLHQPATVETIVRWQAP